MHFTTMFVGTKPNYFRQIYVYSDNT